jgi:hypothetical protein
MDTDNNNDDESNNLEKISIKTDTKGNRIVIKSNESTNGLSNNQNKLLNIKKPIIKRTLTSNATAATNKNAVSAVLRNNEDQQGQVALKLLGDFIKKPNEKNTKNDGSIFKRLTF